MPLKEVAWSHETYDTKTLLEKFETSFPQLANVTMGYYGEEEIATLGADQVLLIRGYGVQKRVIATDRSNRSLSIPIDYPIKFSVLNKKGKAETPEKLADIVETNKLPVRVSCQKDKSADFYIGTGNSQSHLLQLDNQGSLNITELMLKEVYSEKFYKVNTINGGTIDGRSIVLPMYLSIRLAVGVGLIGGTEEEWTQYQDYFIRAVSDEDLSNLTGNNYIALYSKPPEDDHSYYEFTEPKHYIKLSWYGKPREPEPARPIEIVEITRRQSLVEPVYDECIEPAPKLPERQPLEQDVEKQKQKYLIPDTTRKQSITEDPNTLQAGIVKQLAEKLGLKGLKPRVEKNSYSVTPTRKTKPPTTPKPLVTTDTKISISSVSPVGSAVSTPEEDYEIIEQPMVAERTFMNSSNGRVDEKTNEVPSLPQSPKPSVDMTSRELPPVSSVVRDDTNVSSSKCSSFKRGTREKLGNIRLLEDVPADISCLTVEHINTCLSLLKLDKYAEVFNANQVDGEMLLSLDADLLMSEEFGFSKFHAHKLMKFSREGWRPHT